jgi:predicted amidophosphoribosyltransferase
MTTGATLNAAAVALKKAGCSKVYALTLAKTLFDEE